jgi:glycosyltransferase involved in cell wall biosynthesis
VRRQDWPLAEIIVLRDKVPFHKAINAAAEQVTTPFFLQVDSDMILDPHCVRALRRAMRPNVGIAVGYLRDAMMERVVGIKLFRTDCFKVAAFRDSITPDTDFGEEIRHAGWQTVFVGRPHGPSDLTTLGEHRPSYEPAYTYRKYLMEGQRYTHRRDIAGFRWHLGRLEHSRHPAAFVAQVALARGFFRPQNRDALGLMQGDEEFALLEEFLRCDKDPYSVKPADLRSAASATMRDRFYECFQIGKALFEAHDPVAFARFMKVLNSREDDPSLWICKLALCRGLLASTCGDNTVDGDRAFVLALLSNSGGLGVERSRLKILASADQPGTPDSRNLLLDSKDLIDEIMGHAADLGLRRFAVAPALAVEYVAEDRPDGAAYRTTPAKVMSFTDRNGRPRVNVPFRPFGHIVCTDRERLKGLFWCLGLLKGGYLFVHVRTSFGWYRELLPTLLAHNVFERLRRHPGQSAASKTAFALARIVHPSVRRYQPETRRVLMVTGNLGRGGSERQMVAVISELVRRDYDVKVLSLERDHPGVPSFAEEITRLGVAIEFTPETEGFFTASIGPSVSFFSPDFLALPEWFADRIAAIAAVIEREKPGAVHCWLDNPGVWGAIAACRLGVPRTVIQLGSTTAIIRRNAEIAGLLRHAYRALARNPSVKILNNSMAGARDYEAWLELPRGRIAVLYNGLITHSARIPKAGEATQFRAALGLAADAAVVGTVMRFVPEKDPDLWLDTAAAILELRPDVRFLIVGYGVLESEMRKRIESLGLSERIVLAGPIADTGLAYAAMDVVLLTSAVEGLPNVMIEAQAVGRPVIGPDVGGMREALLEGRTGFIVRRRHASSLAKAVITMLDDRHLRERIRIEGPEFIARRFGLERMADETLGYYRFATRRRMRR